MGPNWAPFANAAWVVTCAGLLALELFLAGRFGVLREWSLITGRGGLQNGRGGHVNFYPYEKGGRKKF